MGRFRLPWFRRGRGAAGGATKKLIQGVVPSGMNNYTGQIFAYDEAKRSFWTTQDGSVICPLDHPYVWPLGTGGGVQTGWNTTIDGSDLADVQNSGPARHTIKMDLDGTIDVASLVATTGTTSLTLVLPSVYDPDRASEIFQMQFVDPVPGVTLGSGSKGISLANDDGGVGRLWKVTITGVAGGLAPSISVPVSSMTSGKIRRPRVVPHPTLGVTRAFPEPVGFPAEVARLKKVGMIFRTLDMGRYNARVLNGDTLTTMRLRTAEATDYLFSSNGVGEPRLSLPELITIANEAGVGMQVIFSHRDHPSLLAWQAQQLTALKSPYLFVEFSNEVWNSRFIQNTEISVMGLRAGYAVSNNSAGAVPVAYQYPYVHTTSVSIIDHVTGDQVIINSPSAGVGVWQALANNPKGTAFPKIHSKTVAWNTGDVVFASSEQTIWVAIQPVPGNNTIDRTNTAYWRVLSSTNPSDIAICPWAHILYEVQGRWAMYRYRAYMTNLIKGLVDTARTGAGKTTSQHIWNIQNTTTYRGEADAASATEPGIMLEFDNSWQTNPIVMKSVYLGITAMGGTELLWQYTNDGPNYGVLATDKQALYRTDIDGITAVNNLADKMLSDTARAYYTSKVSASIPTAITTGPFPMQGFVNAKLAAWNAANPGNPIAPITVRIGWYETGFQGATESVGWPDEAKAWNSATTYAAGYAQANFATYSGNLYRCKGTATVGLSPADDITANGSVNWEVIPPAVDFDGQSRVRIGALANAVWHHPNMEKMIKELSAVAQAWAVNQGGFFLSNVYTTVRPMMSAAGEAFGYRFYDDETLLGSPAWYAATENFTTWSALP